MEIVGTLIVVALLAFIVVWYEKALKKAVEPMTYVVEGVAVKAKVYGASIKASAIEDASKLKVDAKTLETGKKKLEQINSFDF